MPLFAAIALSAFFMLLLCHGDPKRRRAARLPDGASLPVSRSLLAGAAFLPGLWCALSGGLAAVLIWMGACAAFGWGLALIFARQGETAADGAGPQQR